MLRIRLSAFLDEMQNGGPHRRLPLHDSFLVAWDQAQGESGHLENEFGSLGLL